jgi:hypothetical protein
MLHPTMMMIAGALAIAAPGNDMSNDELIDAPALAAVAGSILGAASACDGIGKDRLSTASKRAAVLIVAIAKDENELGRSKRVFAEGVGTGRGAVRSGNVDCGKVEASLARLERLGDQVEGEPDQNEDSGGQGRQPEPGSGSSGAIAPPRDRSMPPAPPDSGAGGMPVILPRGHAVPI